MEFTTRAYNSFALNPKTKASIIKTSEEDRLKGEAEYYLELPDDLKVFFPRMINCDLTPPYSICLLYTSPSPRDVEESRMPSSA